MLNVVDKRVQHLDSTSLNIVELNLFGHPFEQGLEGYSRDPGFDQNKVRDSGKRKISRRDSGFDCYQGSGIRQNLGTGCGILLHVCREFGKSSRPN